MHVDRRLLVLGLVTTLARVALLAEPSQPQQTPAATSRPQALATDEATLVAQSWSALAQGDLAAAAQKLAVLRSLSPRAVSTLVLGVEIDLARAGSVAALDGYERWLGTTTLEDPFVLRRIARATLVEASAPGSPAAWRVSALMALADDGDATALANLAASAGEGGLAELSAMAAHGNEDAVARVITAIGQAPGDRRTLIRALADSGSRQAVNALLGLLNDPRPEHRAVAIEGLGRLNVRESISRIRLLMGDPISPPEVTIAAAGALARMDDLSGMDILQQAVNSEVSGMRLLAAQAMSGRQDDEWRAVVQRLAQDADPNISIAAARMIAPLNPDLARSTLETLAQDQNIAVREAASRVLGREVATDFRTLRRLLRSPDVEARVGAAARLLDLTR